MLFNSLDFVIFLPIVFVLYWHVFNKNIVIQNRFILFASLFFYAWWDWRFLSLLVATSLIDYWVAIQLDQTEGKRKRNYLLAVSLITNLGNLFFFKYCNFFIENFNAAFRFMGQPISIDSLNIVLPVGISFYTFQTLSYTIDVYKGKIKATQDATAFMAYVSFFPQLVAGPIERAVNLVPQFFKKREYNYNQFVDGLRQMLWGLFKKMVIADNCAIFANMIFNRHDEFNGMSMMIGTFFFSFQLYCDFSGYSDIAIGCARLFGFNLMKNFNFPFFSRDIPEYWRRWHLSQTTWFRDYIYQPLGGSRMGPWMNIRNVFAIFMLSAIWHGANWTFVIWGLLNFLFFIPYIILNKNRKYTNHMAEGKIIPGLYETMACLSTFTITSFGRIFFRAENVDQAFSMIGKICSTSLFSIPNYENKIGSLWVILACFVFIVLEWFGRTNEYAIEKYILNWPNWLRKSFYYGLIFCILYFGNTNQKYIYFDF